jgi:hypothetical protein
MSDGFGVTAYSILLSRFGKFADLKMTALGLSVVFSDCGGNRFLVKERFAVLM